MARRRKHAAVVAAKNILMNWYSNEKCPPSFSVNKRCHDGQIILTRLMFKEFIWLLILPNLTMTVNMLILNMERAKL